MTHYIFGDSPYSLIVLASMEGCNDLMHYDDAILADCARLGLDPRKAFYANSDDVAKRVDLQMAVQHTQTRYADLVKAAIQRTEAA